VSRRYEYRTSWLQTIVIGNSRSSRMSGTNRLGHGLSLVVTRTTHHKNPAHDAIDADDDNTKTSCWVLYLDLLLLVVARAFLLYRSSLIARANIKKAQSASMSVPRKVIGSALIDLHHDETTINDFPRSWRPFPCVLLDLISQRPFPKQLVPKKIAVESISADRFYGSPSAALGAMNLLVHGIQSTLQGIQFIGQSKIKQFDSPFKIETGPVWFQSSKDNFELVQMSDSGTNIASHLQSL
jgi:hypothetical protein